MQCCIGGVFKPTLDENTVIWLQREVLSHVVHNYGLVEGAPNPTQVLDEDHTRWAGVLSVEPV